ncbi:ribonuclease domain-containing protein [Streptomyces sp. NPDC057445]|uniref:ribonuclease domain-containing protein n=1 Tax=Streptomyces sp. NPDC057445 TaxID=3346136 RepID=UPI0036A6F7E6
MLHRPLLRRAMALLVLLGVLLAGCSAASEVRSPAPTSTPALGSVRAAELPPEARETLRLIDRGGPFPYAKDGATFGNFEGILPGQRRGYYHEYTVRTPGERDRGARRIVTGQRGEIYYTDDHYETFREVLR